MERITRMKYLSIALYAIGVVFIVGVPAMMMVVWPDGWSWSPAQPEYEQMIMGIYITLGIFLIRSAKDPMEHASLIWFTIWSSIVHAGIMLAQAIEGEREKPFTLHPAQTDRKKLERSSLVTRLKEGDNIELRPRYSYLKFIKLSEYASFVINDGDSNQEECYYMGKPCIILRTTG